MRSDIELDDLKRRFPTSISGRIKLKRRGSRWKALCPFHPEKTPSWTLRQYPDGTYLWHCFGCKRGGSVIDFVMESERCELPEAIQIVRSEMNLSVQNLPAARVPDNPDKLTFSEEKLREYEAALTGSDQSDSAISHFLEARGIPIETARKLRYGFRAEPRPAIVLPRFWEGELVGVKYRALNGQEQKWIQEPGSKSDFLYGADMEPVDPECDVVGVFEGELDTALVRSLGFNAMGIFGTGGVPSNPSSRFLESVARMKERYNHVLLIGDSDDAGVDAMHDLNGYIGRGAAFFNIPKPHKDIGDYYQSEGKDHVLEWLKLAYAIAKECRPVPRGTPREQMEDTLRKALAEVELGTEPDIVAHALRSELSGIFPTPIKPLGNAALYGLLGELVERQLPESEADAASLLFQAMALCGNFLGPNPHFRVRGTKHHTNLFVCLVGETASAKGEALDCAKNLLRQADPTWEGVTGLNSGEGIAAIAQDDKAGDEKDGPKKIKCVPFLEPEFARLLEASYRKGSTVGMALRLAWEDLRFQVVNKNTPLNASALVSLIGHITPTELRQKMAREDITNGFANRILWVKVGPSKDIPGAGRDLKFEDLAERLNQAKRIAEEVGEMDLDEEAGELWHSLYRDLKHRPDNAFGKVTARARPYIKRMAMIYALLPPTQSAATDCSPLSVAPFRKIRLEPLQAALEAWHFAEQSAYQLFSEPEDPRATKITKFCTGSPKSRSEIMADLFQGHISAAALQELLTPLLSRGRLVAVKNESGRPGRPSESFLATN